MHQKQARFNRCMVICSIDVDRDVLLHKGPGMD
jgi:hypothetical protein